MLCLNISHIAIITAKGVDYCCIIFDISKFEGICLLENFVFQDCGYIKEISIKNRVYDYFDNLMKPTKLEAKNIVIHQESCKDFVIYFTRYECGKSIRHYVIN